MKPVQSFISFKTIVRRNRHKLKLLPVGFGVAKKTSRPRLGKAIKAARLDSLQLVVVAIIIMRSFDNGSNGFTENYRPRCDRRGRRHRLQGCPAEDDATDGRCSLTGTNPRAAPTTTVNGSDTGASSGTAGTAESVMKRNLL